MTRRAVETEGVSWYECSNGHKTYEWEVPYDNVRRQMQMAGGHVTTGLVRVIDYDKLQCPLCGARGYAADEEE